MASNAVAKPAATPRRAFALLFAIGFVSGEPLTEWILTIDHDDFAAYDKHAYASRQDSRSA
jgi:hypothetical protein